MRDSNPRPLAPEDTGVKTVRIPNYGTLCQEKNHVFKKSGGAQETEGVVAGAVGKGVRYLPQYP